MIRLFVACPLPKPAEDELDKIVRTLKERDGAVKWVASKNIHLTIRFLGDTDERLVSDISRKIDIIGSQFPAIDSTVGKLGAFPNLRRPRIIWAGLDGGIETLTQVSAASELAAQDLGFEAESKGFRAHLTLGRVREHRSPADLVEFLQDFELSPIAIRFDRIVLFKSTLTPTGPIYDRLHEAALAR